MEEKQVEKPLALDIALEIQEALKPFTYEMFVFSVGGGEITIKLHKIGFYSDLSMY